jgi:hypothetical protein
LERFATEKDMSGAVFPLGVFLRTLGTAELGVAGDPAVPEAAFVKAPQPTRVVDGDGVLDNQFGDIPNCFGSLMLMVVE